MVLPYRKAPSLILLVQVPGSNRKFETEMLRSFGFTQDRLSEKMSWRAGALDFNPSLHCSLTPVLQSLAVQFYIAWRDAIRNNKLGDCSRSEVVANR